MGTLLSDSTISFNESLAVTPLLGVALGLSVGLVCISLAVTPLLEAALELTTFGTGLTAVALLWEAALLTKLAAFSPFSAAATVTTFSLLLLGVFCDVSGMLSFWGAGEMVGVIDTF